MNKLSILLCVLMLLSFGIPITAIADKNEDNTVIIGHAITDENKRRTDGKAGDQTGDEVCTRMWYDKPWTVLLRAKNAATAEALAVAMEAACANDTIGYDQRERTTLYDCAKAQNWDLSAITTACETDCSALIAVCANAAGIEVSKDIYTGNLQQQMMDTDAFDLYTDSTHLKSKKHLKRGDILLGKGHTVMVLQNTPKSKNNITSLDNKAGALAGVSAFFLLAVILRVIFKKYKKNLDDIR